MRFIDMQNWPRYKHFEFFNAFDYPHFNICANVDITGLQTAVKRDKHSFTMTIVYVLAKTANGIVEFRQRIRDGAVVEHERVHPSPTVLTDNDLFSFCTLHYDDDFSVFAARAEETMAKVKENPTLEDEPGQDDLLFLTAIPWVSFTSFYHPVHMHPVDSVPRLAWGKYFVEGDRVKMPLSVQVHHALMDGVHVGRFFNRTQACFDRPDFLKVTS